MPRFLHVPPFLQVRNRAALAFFFAAAAASLTYASPARSQAIHHRGELGFGATVTSVETSLGSNGWHYLTTSVHLQNRTPQPLILGVEPAKVSSRDDQHNAYAVLSTRGIGAIAGTRVDPKFALPPGEGGDALFEMRWRGERTTLFGTTFDLSLPVRVILPLAAGQLKLGTEYLMTFTGLKAGDMGMPEGSQTLPKDTVNAGPFTVQITGLTPSDAGRWHIATLAARVQNTSEKPLVLAYEGTSSFGIDDKGNRYGYGAAGSHDTSVSGIGLVTSSSADPQFVLAPSESRDIQFTVWRAHAREEAGTLLTYSVALAQLEALPGNQIRTVRQYSLTFPRLAGLN